MTRLTKKLARELREIATTADMETASFRNLGSDPLNSTVVLRGPGGELDTGLSVDEFIKERTRIWRQSWVVNPLREILGDDV